MKAEKERKKQQNSERKIKFYDANESKKEKMMSERRTKAIEKFMIRNSRKGRLYAPNVLDGNMC